MAHSFRPFRSYSTGRALIRIGIGWKEGSIVIFLGSPRSLPHRPVGISPVRLGQTGGHRSALSPSGLIAVAVLTLLLAACADDEQRLVEFMERGDAYVEQDLNEEAIIEYKNVLQIDPNHAGAHEALSKAFLQVGKPREAYWEMTETVRLDPENIQARLRYGTLSSAVGDYDLALEQANEILNREPSRPQALLLRAQARENLDDAGGADEDYLAAIASDPDGAAYRFLYAGFLERQDRVGEAEQALRDLIEREPSFLAYSNLARLVARRGDDAEQAEQLLRRTIEVALEAPTEKPEQPAGEEEGVTTLIANTLRPDAVQGAHLMLSAFYYEQDRFDDSVAVLEEGIAQVENKAPLIYQMARLYRAQGEDDKADELLRRATTASPDDAGPQLVLSAYLGQQGDLDGALEAAIAAVEIDPENRAAQLREAELRVDVGYRDGDTESIQKGRAIVDAVLEAEPSSPEAHFVRAKIELAEEDFPAAEQSLLTVLETRPDWPQARFVLGSALAVAGEVGRARVELARAIELDPAMTDARKLLAQVHAQLGEHEFAIEQGRAYLKQVPGDAAIRIIVGQSLIRVDRAQEAYDEVSKIPEAERGAPAYFALGRLDVAFGRLEQGRARLLKAQELSPGNASVLGTLLALDRQSGDFSDIAARIDEAAAANPNDSALAKLQADVALAKNDRAGAEAALLRSVELEPKNLSAQLALAEMKRIAGDDDGMLSTLESAAQSLPEAADLHFRLAQAYEQRGDAAAAIAAYEKAIGLNGNLGQAKNNLAYLLAETPGGDLDRALELAQQARELAPDDPNAADTLGWVLLKRGVPSAAIIHLEEAANGFPAEALEVQGIVRNHLAAAYEKSGDTAKAVAASRTSIGHFEKLSKAIAERGGSFEEPEWASQAKDRVARLGASG